MYYLFFYFIKLKCPIWSKKCHILSQNEMLKLFLAYKIGQKAHMLSVFGVFFVLL